MTPGQLLRKEAEAWLDQAAKDRNAAKALIEIEASRSVFHSRQAAEKAIKGFLTLHQIQRRFASAPGRVTPNFTIFTAQNQ